MASQSERTSVLTRLRVMLSLLAGLRWRDITSARQFSRVRFPQDPWPLRFLRLLRWSLDVMWRQIPESLPWVTFDDALSHTPYWLTTPNPLQNHPWAGDRQARLPEAAAAVVVGAGFGGAAVAYHWSKHGTEPLVVLERDEAASGSAGRNAGILVMSGGSYGGYYVYVPVLEYLTKTQPEISPEERDELSTRFARAYVRAVQASHEMIKRTIETEGINCDYARKGWVVFTDPVAQSSLEASFALASRLENSDRVRRGPEQVL